MIQTKGYKMQTEMELHPIDVQENIRLPSERQVRLSCAIAPIAALDASLATTKTAIQCDNPCMQELMDMIEDGDDVPPHFFIAHNIIDNIDRLRLTIRAYFDQVHAYMEKLKQRSFPF